MTTDQLLDQLQCLLSSCSPVVEKSNLPQGSTIHVATRENDTLPAEGVPPLPPRDPSIADKGVGYRNFQNPQFYDQDEKPSRQANGIRARCQAWLEARLSDGPVPLETVLQEAKTLGFSTKAIRLARSHLHVRPLPCLTLTSHEE